jgi:SPP1 family predicted phage head-tail adaptor
MYQVDFDRLVTLEVPSETVDNVGQLVRGWTTLAANVPARYKALTGKDTIEGQAPFANESVEFTIRFSTAVTEQVRVVYNGAYYYLKGYPQELGRQHYLKLITERANHDGLQL